MTDAAFPQISAPMVDANGQITQAWYQLLRQLWQNDVGNGGEVQNLVVTTSPFTYLTNDFGAVLVIGGTVSSIEFSRDGVSFYGTGQTTGMTVLSKGDRLRITYSVLPRVIFVPL